MAVVGPSSPVTGRRLRCRGHEPSADSDEETRSAVVKRSILLADPHYHSVLHELELDRIHPDQSYSQLMQTSVDFGFGTGGAVAAAFRDLGWEGACVVPNSLALQAAWNREHGKRYPIRGGWSKVNHMARVPGLRSMLHRIPHAHQTLLAQAAALKPDVMVVQDLNFVTPALGEELRNHVGLLVGEIASALPPSAYFGHYDLIISAHPGVVDHARSLGLPAESVRLGFDPRWRGTRSMEERSRVVTFVGTLHRADSTTIPMLRSVADSTDELHIYGPIPDKELEAVGLRQFYRGEAWGRDMFELLGDSQIVLNRHGDFAGRHAVNMRLYEATGSGAALVTDSKDDLQDLFDVGREVAAYRSPDEAGSIVAGLLSDRASMGAIGAAGQRRTMADHTYRQRAETMADIYERYLRAKS